MTLTVEDNGSGQLSVDEQSITVVQVRNDDGQDVTNGQNVDTATFTNNYNANAGTADIRGEKDYQNESGANDLTDGKFTFKIEALGGYATADGTPAEGEDYAIAATDVPMPKNEAGETVAEVGNVGESFAFPTISYGPNTVDNTYVYEVTEITGNEAGMTYSDKKFIVTVAVTDDTEDADGNAIIVATVTYPAGGVSFTNTFDPEDATLSGEDALGGTKVIDGRDFKAGETFGFTLAPTAETQTAIDNGYVVMPADDGLTATASADTQGAFSFGEVKFTRTGTYKFTINETAHNGKALSSDVVEGMTYDQHTCTVSVTVGLGTGDNAGKLVVTGVDYGTYNQKAGNQFTNTYEANIDYGDAAGGLVVGKTLTGRAMTVGEFDFTITGVDSSTEGAVGAEEANKLLAQGDGSFSNDKNCASGEEDVMTKLAQMSFDQDQAGKVFVYEVREVVPAEGSADRLGGVTYDGTVWTVAIKVVDNLDGTMHTETTVSNGIDSKTYNSDNFGTDGAPKVTFANTYEAQPVTEPAGSYFQGEKTFTGRDMDTDESFGYTLVGADQTTANAMAGDIVEIGETASVEDLTDGAAGTFDFGQVAFHRAGTYAFQVTENIPDAAINANVDDGATTYANATAEQKAKEGWMLDGITYDSHVGTVVIAVADDGNGNLYIDRVRSSVTGMSFSNTYNATPATFGIDGHWDFAKIIDGRDWLDTDSFTFQITASADTPLPSGGTAIEGVHGKTITVSDPNGTDGNPVEFDFGQVEFTFDNMDGQESKEFRYTISEQPSTIAGIKTSGATYQLVITVEDNGTGALEIADYALSQVEDNDGNTLNPAQPVGEDVTATFTNVYTANEDYVQFSGAKGYTDYSRPGDQLETGMFNFTLEAMGGYETAAGAPTDGAYSIPATDVPMPEGTPQGQTSVTIPNAEGAFTFNNITFTQDHDGNTYVYKITEVNDGANKVTYDASEYVASVAVTTTTDDQTHTATIVATPSYTLNGEEYNVTEQNPLRFVNSYDPDDAVLTGQTAIHGTKTMDGRTIGDGETFRFILEPADRRTRTAVENGVISIANNSWETTTAAGDGQGNTADFTFGDITINNVGVAQGDGTYTFNIRELTPRGQNPDQGVTYDTHAARAIVTVSDPDADPSEPGIATGALTASVVYNNNTEGAVTEADKGETTKAAFTNKYTAEPTTVEGDADVSFDLTKQFTGRAGNDWLTTDSFTFTLTQQGKGTYDDGTQTFTPSNPAVAAPMPAGTATGESSVDVTVDRSDRTDVANGIAAIDFAGIEYTEAGDYQYTVTEAKASIGGVHYADNTVTIVVRVTDDQQGQLHAEVVSKTGEQGSTSQGAPSVSFWNSYTTEFGYGAEGMLDITKTLENRAMTDGQFTFTVTATGDNAQGAAQKLGIQDGNTSVEVTAPAANAGTAVPVNNNPFDNLTFTSEERGTTYTYTVEENGESDDNYTLDEEKYTVAITVIDDNSGVLKAQTVVTNAAGEEVANSTSSASEINKITLPFVNTYQASDDTKKVEADINGAKTDVNGKLVGVGDTLTYTIHWVNDAMNADGVPQPAIVTVSDELPVGIEPADIQNGGQYDEATHTITWELGEQAADAQGDVTFTATVTDDAVTVDGMTNDATIEVGDDEPKTTNEVTVDVPEKSETDTTPDNGLQVGDTLDYTVEWANDSGNVATIVVTDVLPAGLTVDEETISEDGSYDASTRTITWTFADQAVDAKGTVSFSATVNEQATTVENPLNNTAVVKVGDVTHTTNTTGEGEKPHTGNLTVSKTIDLTEGQGTSIDANKSFSFTVTLEDAAGNNLTSKYNAQVYNANGAVGPQFQVSGVDDDATQDRNETTFTLKHGEHVVISGLPEGASYSVTELLDNQDETGADYGYTQTSPAADGVAQPATGTISAGDENASAAFTNTYSANPGTVSEGTESAFNLTKQFTGREGDKWAADDEFSFTLTAGKVTDLKGAEVDGLTVPMPADSENGSKTVTVGADKAGADGVAPINFGAISYERTGVYTYTVTEANGGSTTEGITYDGRTVNIKVTVTDNGSGGLVAAVEKTGEGTTASFVNTYDSTIDYSGAEGHAGLEITKRLNNRDMTDGQFTIEVTAADDASAEKLGAQTAELKSTAAVAGEAAPVATNPFDDMTFDRDDAGKTFTYTIAEKNDAAEGYQYDSDVYTVSISPRDNGDGTMTVSTQVSSEGGYNEQTEGVATVPFVNTYDAGDVTIGTEGDATLAATKVLENDDIANYDGAFTFKVTSGDVTVAGGANNADGSITFDDITYTSANLYAAAHGGSDEVGTATLDATGEKDVYTFNYTVSENPVAVDGVSYVSGNESSVTVTVTDDRAGNLTIDVAYAPAADGLVFTNAYGMGAEGTTELTLSGNKTLNGVDGAIPPTLTDGMFEFTITGEDGAPMPETTTVTNKGAGISFGPITYTMEDVFGADEAAADEATAAEGEDAAANEGVETYTAGRTKTFTYTITETNAGKTIDGIAYDGASKTVTVTVTDEGEGKISAAVTKVADGADENMDFSFDNTYSVTPEESSPTEGEGALTITKVWDRQGGTRELAADDFTFQLVSNANEDEVYTATNDAQGNVEMGAIKFTKAGDYAYTLTEVVPEGAKPVDGGYEKDGVLYLSASYVVTAHVTDNHDGTLSVAWTMTDASDKDVTEATFVNAYSVSETTVTFGAGKALEGRAVKDGEFTFELRDAEGNVLGTATNNAEGQVVFADAIQTFGRAGEYDFVVAEVLPEDDDPDTKGVQKDGVTYDETTYTAHVVVSDDNKGNLVVTSLTYNGEAALPVFRNTYVEPEEPVVPEPVEPEAPELPKTSDVTNMVLPAVLAAGGVAVAVTGLALARRKSK